MIDDDVYDDEPSEEEEEEDDEFGGPGGDDDFGGDEGFIGDSDEEDEEASEAPAVARPRRRVSSRQSTVGGVPRSKLEKAEHAAKAWAELSTRAGDEEPAPYSIRGDFPKDSRVDHPKFGVGFVIEVSGPSKIDVLFEDGLRKLVQNR